MIYGASRDRITSYNVCYTKLLRRQMDTMKRKQFIKGVTQIAQEGAIQIFQEFNTGMEEIIVGVVGVLQFDSYNFV